METSQEPTSESAESGLGPIGRFLIKTVIVCAAIVVSGWILLDLLDDFATRRMEQVEQTVRAATSLGGHRFWTKLESELDRLADPRADLSPEKKQKILSQIKAVSDRWRPFLEEAASAIEGESKKAARLSLVGRNKRKRIAPSGRAVGALFAWRHDAGSQKIFDRRGGRIRGDQRIRRDTNGAMRFVCRALRAYSRRQLLAMPPSWDRGAAVCRRAVFVRLPAVGK
jgi:hypothetical protein